MASLVIVAIPSEDDYVWKISSEKKPHCTLLFLGDAATNPNVTKIQEFLEHAVNILEFGPFGLGVDYRGTLGEDDADVLFFRQDDWSLKRVAEFRGQLLKNNAIKAAFDSTSQFGGPQIWTPHLTLGYPESPAKKDDRDYPGIRWVEFDRIALWYGDFEGPEFRLRYNNDLAEVSMSSEAGKEFISHHGVKGMKWGVRKSRTSGGGAAKGALKIADNIWFATGTQSQTVHQGIINRAHKALKKEDLPRLKKKHGRQGVALRNPLSAEAKAYRADVKSAYVKQLEKEANNTTNFQGTLHYTMKDENGKPNTRKYFWGLRVEHHKPAAAHAAGDPSMDFQVHPVFDADGFIIDIVPEETMAQAVEFVEDVLAHYGVKGMKWGVRKAEGAREVQAKSVVRRGLATKSKIKTSGGENHPPHEDAIKAALSKRKLKKSGPVALSNKELQDLATRLNLEQQVRSLANKEPKTAGRQFVDKALQDPHKTIKTVKDVSDTAANLSKVLSARK